MQNDQSVRETLALKENECLMVTSYTTGNFNVPVHYHPEYELLFISNCKGLKSLAGTTEHKTGYMELMLLGPGLPHGWKHNGPHDKIKVIAVHFKKELFTERSLTTDLDKLLSAAGYGVLFPDKTSALLHERLLNLKNLKKKEIIAEVISLFEILATDSEYKTLNINSSAVKPGNTITHLDNYLLKNYSHKITLQDMCSYTGKSTTSFNRFINRATGTAFISYLNSIRTAFAARSLVKTTLSIAAIAEASGFNNLANFNRAFKKRYGITPLQYRERFYGNQIFL